MDDLREGIDEYICLLWDGFVYGDENHTEVLDNIMVIVDDYVKARDSKRDAPLLNAFLDIMWSRLSAEERKSLIAEQRRRAGDGSGQ